MLRTNDAFLRAFRILPSVTALLVVTHVQAGTSYPATFPCPNPPGDPTIAAPCIVSITTEPGTPPGGVTMSYQWRFPPGAQPPQPYDYFQVEYAFQGGAVTTIKTGNGRSGNYSVSFTTFDPNWDYFFEVKGCLNGNPSHCSHPGSGSFSPVSAGVPASKTGLNLTVPPKALDLAICKQGYVWREAVPHDLVCVTPATRDQVIADNTAAPKRHVQNSDKCIEGYVWREAVPQDHVCVTAQTHEQTMLDNAAVASRLGMSRRLLNIEKRSLASFMLRGVGLASKNAM